MSDVVCASFGAFVHPIARVKAKMSAAIRNVKKLLAFIMFIFTPENVSRFTSVYLNLKSAALQSIFT